MMFRLIRRNGVAPSQFSTPGHSGRVFTGSQIEHAVELLRGSRARLRLGEAEARDVLRHMELRVYRQGEVLIHERDVGARHEEMMLVLSGCATVERQLPGRVDPTIVAQLQEGDFLGEMSLLDGEPRSATCRAVTDLEVAILSSSQLLDLINRHPNSGAKLLLAVAQRLAERLRQSAQKLFLYEQMLAAADARMQDSIASATDAFDGEQPPQAGHLQA